MRILKRFDLSKEMKFSLNCRNDTEPEANNKVKNISDLYCIGSTGTLRRVTSLELI